mmetsp:Transcript_10784/g.16157  ORF Transcript_10784/g.16157 Transcript_10784/m.16157 type:complete len:208 (-) Transcript_10784:58-681(-)
MFSSLETSTQCSICHGSGYHHIEMPKTCPTCKGLQHVLSPCQQAIKVHIEPGIQSMSQIQRRVAGRNFIITIMVRKHPHFTRKGGNLHTLRNLTLYEALVGFKFDIRTLDGRLLRIHSEPGEITAHGSAKKILREGLVLPNTGSGRRGDLVIHFKVSWPSNQWHLRKEETDMIGEALKRLVPPPAQPTASSDQVKTVYLENYQTKEK